MSWSAYTTGASADIVDRIDALEPPGESVAERDEQVAAAKAAAKAIIASGAVGTGEAFQVSLSGHTNPEHQPRTGYANDLMMVSVTQTNATVVGEFDKRLAEQQAAVQ